MKRSYSVSIDKALIGEKLDLSEFPELDIIYSDAKNSLCGASEKGAHVTCIWEGMVTLELNINGKHIRLTDHDEKWCTKVVMEMDEACYGRKSSSSKKTYEFQGTGLDHNADTDKLRMLFSITRI